MTHRLDISSVAATKVCVGCAAGGPSRRKRSVVGTLRGVTLRMTSRTRQPTDLRGSAAVVAAAFATALCLPPSAVAANADALAAVAPPAAPSFESATLASRAHADLERAWSKFHEAERYEASPEKWAAYREVEKIVDPMAEAHSQNADVYFLRFASRGRPLQAGNPFLNLTKLASLKRDLNRALELDPDHSEALAAKGGLLLGLPRLLGGDAGEALHFLERAIRFNPRGPGTRLEYARALLRLGRVEEAYEQLRLAGHYACILRRPKELTEATQMLDRIAPKIQNVRRDP